MAVPHEGAPHAAVPHVVVRSAVVPHAVVLAVVVRSAVVPHLVVVAAVLHSVVGPPMVLPQILRFAARGQQQLWIPAYSSELPYVPQRQVLVAFPEQFRQLARLA